LIKYFSKESLTSNAFYYLKLFNIQVIIRCIIGHNTNTLYIQTSSKLLSIFLHLNQSLLFKYQFQRKKKRNKHACEIHNSDNNEKQNKNKKTIIGPFC